MYKILMKCLILLIFLTNLISGIIIFPNHFHAIKRNKTTNATRVVGGRDIPEGQYIPYQVSLQYFTKNNKYQHFCGGSIISPNRILTAAHCCNGLNPKRMSVLAGIRDFSDTNHRAAAKRSQVMSYDIHENYKELVTSDIAILNIDPPLELDGARMAAININSSEKVAGNVPVTLTGWGLRLPVALPFVPENVNYPSTLQTMSYYTITNEQCKNDGMTDLTETEICAKGALIKGACSGDSGGPLVMSTNDGLRQVGIVSYGLMVCGIFDVADVYTRVSIFNDWIAERL